MSEGFFSRWSKLKRGEERVEAQPEAVPEAPPAPVEPEFDVASLPDIESATAETDFTAFLRKGVPEALKRQALRRAWSLDPAIRDFCGPADYAWDFNAVDGVPGFSLSLGGDAAKLLAQAIGQLQRWDEAPAQPAEAPSFLPPGASPAAALAPPEPETLPPSPLRLAEARPEETPLPTDAREEPPEMAPRRHGGARPA